MADDVGAEVEIDWGVAWLRRRPGLSGSSRNGGWERVGERRGRVNCNSSDGDGDCNGHGHSHGHSHGQLPAKAQRHESGVARKGNSASPVSHQSRSIGFGKRKLQGRQGGLGRQGKPWLSQPNSKRSAACSHTSFRLEVQPCLRFVTAVPPSLDRGSGIEYISALTFLIRTPHF